MKCSVQIFLHNTNFTAPTFSTCWKKKTRLCPMNIPAYLSKINSVILVLVLVFCRQMLFFCQPFTAFSQLEGVILEEGIWPSGWDTCIVVSPLRPRIKFPPLGFGPAQFRLSWASGDYSITWEFFQNRSVSLFLPCKQKTNKYQKKKSVIPPASYFPKWFCLFPIHINFRINLLLYASILQSNWLEQHQI